MIKNLRSISRPFLAVVFIWSKSSERDFSFRCNHRDAFLQRLWLLRAPRRSHPATEKGRVQIGRNIHRQSRLNASAPKSAGRSKIKITLANENVDRASNRNERPEADRGQGGEQEQLDQKVMLILRLQETFADFTKGSCGAR